MKQGPAKSDFGRLAAAFRIDGDAWEARLDGDDRAALRAALTGAGLPVEDIAAPGVQLFGFGGKLRRVGYGGLEIYGPDGLLRSIVVDPDARGQGVGREIVRRLLNHAALQGAQRVFLFTVDARAYFETFGFSAIKRNEAPRSILTTRQAETLCPATATLMTKTLVRGPE